ncbi:MAG: endonuclease/exonuclease/phosphatase family protein [Verrucomicrobiae bacterium]|nr:endonuclease/exonuclease/phosphatase family protein [Verrucomicrobiae bacterium]
MSLSSCFTFLFLYVAFAAAPALRANAAPVEIKAVAWNLEWFPGRKPKATEAERSAHMAAAQSVLRALDPDIFLAEEIGDWNVFQQLVSVVPGLHVDTVSAFRQGARGPISRQQVAIASKLPANSTWSEPWKSVGAMPPRGFAFAALMLPNGKLIFVYTVHLKSNRVAPGSRAADNAAKREESSRQLLAHVNDMEKIYGDAHIQGVLIGGDFNTNEDRPEWKGERTLAILEQAGFRNCWRPLPPVQRLTWRGTRRYAATTFDFFFLRGFGHPLARLGPSSEAASDHHPVALVLEIPKETTAHAEIPSSQGARPH